MKCLYKKHYLFINTITIKLGIIRFDYKWK